jgi:flagellar hook-associated protein 1 FlgK
MSDLYVGLSGLLGARRALDVIGQNITNASTPGYARREVVFTPVRNQMGSEMAVGSGVDADTVIRIRDMFLQDRVQAYSAGLERSESQGRYFSEIEALLQEPGEYGLGGQLDQFFNEWQVVASRPEEQATRVALLGTADYLCERVRNLYDDLSSLRNALNLEVGDVVQQVNDLASQLAENNLLADQLGGQNRPLSVEDERDRLMTELAELVGAVNRTPNESKAMVMVGSWTLVSNADSMALRAPEDVNSPVTTEASGGTAAFSCDSGKLAGLLAMSQEVIPSYLERLNELAVSLMRTVNKIHAEGLSSDGRYTDLVASNAPRDMDGDGTAMNDLLSAAGLPFVPSAGALTINVADASGTVTTSSIAVDPEHQTLADLMVALDSVDHLSVAQVNGRLRIVADAGYSFDFCADQETDILAAFGFNALFVGRNASEIRVDPSLIERPELLATGRSTDIGDGSNALAIAALRNRTVSNGLSLSEGWQSFVTQVGSDAAALRRSRETLEQMVTALNEQEQSVSGVSLDEEAAKMIQFQQMYTACARYMATLSQLTDMLLEYL